MKNLDPISVKTSPIHLLLFLAGWAMLAGCASTKVEDRDPVVTGKIPKPDHILVYDFAASASDLPSESALAGAAPEPAQPLTDKELATGRELGNEIAGRFPVHAGH